MPDLAIFQTFGKRSSQPILGATTNAVIYTRVSTKEQAETNQSLAIQKQKCLEYAIARGYTVVGTFGGTYESAKDDTRKEFTRMLRFVQQKTHKVSFIIVLSTDRFSRSGGNAIHLTSELRKSGVILETVTQQTDTRTCSGQFTQNFSLIISQYDNLLRRERTILGMTDRVRKGYWIGKAPLGYTMTKVGSDQQIIINERGRALQKAFHLKADQHLSNTEIVRWLRGQGVKVSMQVLTHVFRNPFYCGLISHSLLNGEVVIGRHPKLISEELFLRLHGLQAHQVQGYVHAKETPTAPLKHHVCCHRCHTALTAYAVKKKGLWYYKCNTIGCRMNVSAKSLHAAYQEILAQYSLASHLVEPLKAQAAAVFHQLNQEGVQERQAVQSAIDKVKRTLADMEKRYALGSLKEEIYEKHARKIQEEELAPLVSERQRLGTELSNLVSYTDFAVEMSAQLPALWEKADLTTRHQLQKLAFPNGVAYAPEKGLYRTGRANVVLELINRKPVMCKDKKNGLHTTEGAQSTWVGPLGIEPRTY